MIFKSSANNQALPVFHRIVVRLSTRLGLELMVKLVMRERIAQQTVVFQLWDGNLSFTIIMVHFALTTETSVKDSRLVEFSKLPKYGFLRTKTG